MNPPLIISILMPVKNTALFLNECLDSIVNQNELNFELMLREEIVSRVRSVIIKVTAKRLQK